MPWWSARLPAGSRGPEGRERAVGSVAAGSGPSVASLDRAILIESPLPVIVSLSPLAMVAEFVALLLLVLWAMPLLVAPSPAATPMPTGAGEGAAPPVGP